MSHLRRPRFDPRPAPFALAGPVASLSAAAAPALSGRAKRSFDIVLALALLAAFALPMLAMAAWIRLDSPGPVLFRQRRVGRYGREFDVLKFRTMRAGPRAAAPAGTAFCPQARRDDPRITRAGARLRRFSCDELPQLFNVLRGEMSLVGPRPHAPGTCAGGRPFEQVAARYAARHAVRPGMTGLAQVRGLRGATETEDKLRWRVDADLEYIATWSLRLDLAILLRTVPAVLRATNAY
jgi:polysaccharide biosynthesis protein PslA